MSRDASSRRQTTPCAQPQAVLRAKGCNAEQAGCAVCRVAWGGVQWQDSDAGTCVERMHAGQACGTYPRLWLTLDVHTGPVTHYLVLQTLREPLEVEIVQHSIVDAGTRCVLVEFQIVG